MSYEWGKSHLLKSGGGAKTGRKLNLENRAVWRKQNDFANKVTAYNTKRQVVKPATVKPRAPIDDRKDDLRYNLRIKMA